MIIILGAMDSEINEFLAPLQDAEITHWNGFTQYRGRLAGQNVQHDLESAGLRIPRGQVPFSDYRFLPANPALLDLASRFKPCSGTLHLGRICTGDQFITHRELDSHAYLTEELEGDGVEMEGASVALVCTVNNVPFLVTRTISDRADGKAGINFEAFLPQASLNSLDLVCYLLPLIAEANLSLAT